jgi:DNA-binding transcriptional regulator YiaG
MMLTPENIRQPVALARLLARNGISLRRAHDLLGRLTAGETVAVELHPIDTEKMAFELLEAGVKPALIEYPSADVKRVREHLGYSQSEFALRYGIEIDTLQNWEQHRSDPDRPTQLLLKLIESHREIVEKFLTIQVPPLSESERKRLEDSTG